MLDRFTIRNVLRNDIPAIQELTENFPEAGVYTSQFWVESSIIFRPSFWVAETLDKVYSGHLLLGREWDHPDTAWGLSFAITPEHRGTGLHSKMILHCQDQARNLGIHYLKATVWSRE